MELLWWRTCAFRDSHAVPSVPPAPAAVTAPKANVVQVVPDGYVLIWNYFGAEPVPVVIPIPVPLVPPAPAVVIPIPVPLVPPAPAVVSIVLDYWWEHGFFGCGENFAHDDVNVQWRQFYRQHRA
mgnify:CR=1 FL=1